MEPLDEYEQYIMLHRDFSKAYSQVYKHVMEFYPLPQKFIKEAKPEIDTYVEKFAVDPGDPEKHDTFDNLLYFARNFKDFAAHANEVYEEYKGLHGESGEYIKSVFRLKEKCNGPDHGDSEFAKLIPALNKLIGGFKRVEQKTNEAARNLQQLQSDWRKLKENIDPENRGTAWPL